MEIRKSYYNLIPQAVINLRTAAEYIHTSFCWPDTEQRYDYWHELHSNLKNVANALEAQINRRTGPPDRRASTTSAKSNDAHKISDFEKFTVR